MLEVGKIYKIFSGPGQAHVIRKISDGNFFVRVKCPQGEAEFLYTPDGKVVRDDYSMPYSFDLLLDIKYRRYK